jgi:leader peptidase HopD
MQDMRYGCFPINFTCPCYGAGLLFYLCLQPDFLPMPSGGDGRLSLFAVIYWGYRGPGEGMGYGDVKYLAALGAWHGWRMLPQLAGSALAALLFFRRRRKGKKTRCLLGHFWRQRVYGRVANAG